MPPIGGGGGTIGVWAERLVKVGATVFRQEPDQLCSFRPINCVVDESPGALGGEQTAPSECVEVMRQRRSRQLNSALDLLHAISLRSGANQQAEDLEPVLLPQGAKLFDVSVHYDLSSIIEMTRMQQSRAQIFGKHLSLATIRRTRFAFGRPSNPYSAPFWLIVHRGLRRSACVKTVSAAIVDAFRREARFLRGGRYRHYRD